MLTSLMEINIALPKRDVTDRAKLFNTSLQEARIWGADYLDSLQEHSKWKLAHSYNVAVLSYRIATEVFSYSSSEAEMFMEAGIVHDIGCLDVSEDIINKDSVLSYDEFELQKIHVEGTLKRLPDTEKYTNMAKVIRGHHQFRNDPYPALTDEEEGLDKSSRLFMDRKILALADQVEALMASKQSSRPYKEPSTPEETIRLLTHARDGSKTEYFTPEEAKMAAELGQDFFDQEAL